MLKATDILKALFARQSEITITNHGPSDAFGYARCLLSDGRWKTLRDPCTGYPVYTVEHLPKIIPCESNDVWHVTPWQEEERIVTVSELRDMVKNI